MQYMDDDSGRPLLAQVYSEAVRELTGTVAEIGSGRRWELCIDYLLAERVIGIDPIAAGARTGRRVEDRVRHLRTARQPVPKRDPIVVAAHGERLPFRAGVLDAVVCSLSLCTFKPGPLDAVLREVARVLAPGRPLHVFAHLPSSEYPVLSEDGCDPESDPRAAISALFDIVSAREQLVDRFANRQLRTFKLWTGVAVPRTRRS